MADLAGKIQKKDGQLFEEVRKLQQNEAGDYNRLYELSKNYIYKIIYDIVKDPFTTEDLMQETYLQIYNKINTLEHAEAFYVWAGRIATNLTLRYIQKNRHEVPAVADETGSTDFVFETVHDDTEAFIPEAVLMNREKQRLIGDIIDGLSTEQKIAVQFFYFEEMSVREIAQAMHCAEGTVKSRLNYARKAIKEAVIDLDVREGTRLYSLSSLPLIFWVFRMLADNMKIVPVGATAAASVSGASVAGGAASAGKGMAAGGAAMASATGKGAAATMASAAGKGASAGTGVVAKMLGTTAGKVIAGVVTVVVVTTGVVTLVKPERTAPDPDVVAEVTEEEEVEETVTEPVEEEAEEEEETDNTVVFADSYLAINYDFSGLESNYPDYPNPRSSFCSTYFTLPEQFKQETAGLVKSYPMDVENQAPEEIISFLERTFPEDEASGFFTAHQEEAANAVTFDNTWSITYDDERDVIGNRPYKENVRQTLPDSFTFVYEGVEYTFHIEDAVAYIICSVEPADNLSPYFLERARGTVVEYDHLESELYPDFGKNAYLAYASSLTYTVYGYATCDKQALLEANNVTQEDIDAKIAFREEIEEKTKAGTFYAFYAPKDAFPYATGFLGERGGELEDGFWYEISRTQEISHPDLTTANGSIKAEPGWIPIDCWGDDVWDVYWGEQEYGPGYYFIYHTGLKQFVRVDYLFSVEGNVYDNACLYHIKDELE